MYSLLNLLVEKGSFMVMEKNTATIQSISQSKAAWLPGFEAVGFVNFGENNQSICNTLSRDFFFF